MQQWLQALISYNLLMYLGVFMVETFNHYKGISLAIVRFLTKQTYLWNYMWVAVEYK